MSCVLCLQENICNDLVDCRRNLTDNSNNNSLGWCFFIEQTTIVNVYVENTRALCVDDKEIQVWLFVASQRWFPFHTPNVSYDLVMSHMHLLLRIHQLSIIGKSREISLDVGMNDGWCKSVMCCSAGVWPCTWVFITWSSPLTHPTPFSAQSLLILNTDCETGYRLITTNTIISHIKIFTVAKISSKGSA